MTMQATLREAPSPHHGQRMSLADYEALPEEKPYLEYWDGTVLQKAVPNMRHARLQLALGAALFDHARSRGGVAGSEVHVWFEGRGYLLPDVAYWAPGKPQGDDRRSLPPTLAIEIRSPDQPLAEQREKCRLMRANGVDVCWLVDPETRSVEVFEGERDGEAVEADRTLGSASLPGFTLPLRDLFAILDG
jgi:Uma2 family endonuclease